MTQELKVQVAWYIDQAWKIIGVLGVPAMIGVSGAMWNLHSRVVDLETRAAVVDATRFTSSDGVDILQSQQRAHAAFDLLLAQERGRVDRLEERVNDIGRD